MAAIDAWKSPALSQKQGKTGKGQQKGGAQVSRVWAGHSRGLDTGDERDGVTRLPLRHGSDASKEHPQRPAQTAGGPGGGPRRFFVCDGQAE